MVKNFLLALLLIISFCLPVRANDYYRPLQDFSVSGINATSTGATLVGTTLGGSQTFHPLFVVFKMINANTIAVVPIVSVGTNSAIYNNVLALTTLTGLTSTGVMLPSNIVAAIGSIPASTGIFVNIGTGATATTATLEVHVFGYYN